MAYVCDLKSDPQQSKPDDEDLEDGEIEDDEEDTLLISEDSTLPHAIVNAPALPALVPEALPHKDKPPSEKSSSKESRKERKVGRHEKHDKKYMTEAEKSVLYLHKMERIEREKRGKYRRDQGHTRRARGSSASPPPPTGDGPVGTADAHHAPTNVGSAANTIEDDDVADEDFATSLERVLQSVLKKDKSAQAQAAVASVNQATQAAVSSNTTEARRADAAAKQEEEGVAVGVGEGGAGEDDKQGGEREEISSRKLARRRRKERKKDAKALAMQSAERQESEETFAHTADVDIDFTADVDVKGFADHVARREISTGLLVEELRNMKHSSTNERKRMREKKAVKRARLEAVITAALGSDGPQLDPDDSNSNNANVNGTSPSHMNNNKMDTGDDTIQSEHSSSDEEPSRRDRRSRGDRRCSRKMKRKYRSAERDSGIGGSTPTKVKKGETKLGLCLSYIQGKCMNRDCPYSHEYSPHMKLELCKFYLMECCAKGDKCYYLHKEFPCKYYHTGLPCIDGDKCKFNHGKPLSDSFRSVLCKHIETAPKEILGDFPRFNREDAMNMIAITQKKLEEKYSKKEENKDMDKDDKRDAKRNRVSRWQDPERKHEQKGSVVNLSFLHDTDQDMRFSSNGDIDMRTLPTTSTASIPLPATINTSTPPPNLILHPNHSQKQSSPKQHLSAISPNNHKSANLPPSPSQAPPTDPQALLLQQLGVSNQTAAALLLAGAQSGAAGAAAVAALLQSMGRTNQAHLLAGVPIVAGSGLNAKDEDSDEAGSNQQQQPPPQLPITMQIPPPQLNPNAILFSTPPPSLLSTPPPNIRPSNLGQIPVNHKQPQQSISANKPTTTTTTTKPIKHEVENVVPITSMNRVAVGNINVPITSMNRVAVGNINKAKVIKKENMVKEGIKMELDIGVNNIKQEGLDDSDMLDIERYKREAGIGRIKIKKEDIKMEVKEELEDEDGERCLQIDCDPPLSDTEQPKSKELSPKPDLPNLPRTQMDLFLRIQSQQAKSSSTNIEHSPIHVESDKDTSPISNLIKDNDCDPNSTIDWYSDDDDDDDDDDDKLTIGEDADPYDDIITKTVDLVPKSSMSKKVDVPIQKEKLLPPVVEVVPRAEQIVEQLGDLSKIDISAEVTKLLTSISSSAKKSSEENSSSTSCTKPSTYTPPTDPRTASIHNTKNPSRSASDPRTDPRTVDPRTAHRHHHHHHHRRSSDASSSPNLSPIAQQQHSTTTGGRADPRRRRSSAESSDGGRSSGSDGRSRVPVPSIYDQATASFRMSNNDLDLRLAGSVPVPGGGDSGDDVRAKLADVDLRSVSQGGRPDIDLRATMPQQLSLPLQFKAAMAAYTPATEIDATYHASYVWRIYEVDVPRPDYSGLRLTEAEARSTGDPRLEKIFRLASGGAGDLKPEENKEKAEFTIDDSPASPIREQPVAKPSTPRVDPRRRKPVDEPLSSNPPPSDPNQLSYAQQLSLLQTSSFYQNLTSNQKLNLNHELSQRMQQPQQLQHNPPRHHHLQQQQQQQQHPVVHLQQHQGANDPVMGAVLQSLGLTGRHMGEAQQLHQQQQMMGQLQQFGALGLLQQVQQQQQQQQQIQGGIGGGGGGPRGAGSVGMLVHGGVLNNQQGLLGAAPGVPHDFNNPIQQPQPFLSGPPNLHPNNNFNNSPNYGNSPNNDNYDQYDPDDNDNSYGNNNINCYNNNPQQQHPNNNNMMGGGRNNQRGGNQGGGFRDNRNNNRRGGNQQGQNRSFGNNRNNRSNFRRNRNNNNNNPGGGNQNRGGIVE